mmetsp:Transcript_15964/g.23684  ORF Transcript_15964/g.23684 Transcript_15964/m.23684 type:complete len:207 (+) Transcript_15964:229-849(+)
MDPIVWLWLRAWYQLAKIRHQTFEHIRVILVLIGLNALRSNQFVELLAPLSAVCFNQVVSIEPQLPIRPHVIQINVVRVLRAFDQAIVDLLGHALQHRIASFGQRIQISLKRLEVSPQVRNVDLFIGAELVQGKFSDISPCFEVKRLLQKPNFRQQLPHQLLAPSERFHHPLHRRTHSPCVVLVHAFWHVFLDAQYLNRRFSIWVG